MPAGTLSRAFLIFRASSGATCRVSPARHARHTASAATPPLPIKKGSMPPAKSKVFVFVGHGRRKEKKRFVQAPCER